jgi:hypothetical protein
MVMAFLLSTRDSELWHSRVFHRTVASTHVYVQVYASYCRSSQGEDITVTQAAVTAQTHPVPSATGS